MQARNRIFGGGTVKDSAPWMPFYGRGFYSDENVMLMTLEQEAAYERLRWHCWQAGDSQMSPQDGCDRDKVLPEKIRTGYRAGAGANASSRDRRAA